MGSQTAIQWCDRTFNPWVGCSKVHTGCLNCYAEADFDKRKHFAHWGPHGTRVKTTKEYWRKPFTWNAAAKLGNFRERVFCASLADVFENWTGRIFDSNGLTLHHGKIWGSIEKYLALDVAVGKSVVTMDDLRRDLFSIIDITPNLDWLLLTKRPENILNKWLSKRDLLPIFPVPPSKLGLPIHGLLNEAFRRNVWLGTSVSDQSTTNAAIPELLKCRDLSPVLFLSVEPLVGPIEAIPKLDRLDWVIVGGESGPNARPCRMSWIASIIRQCKGAGVPCFVKQLGSNAVGFYGSSIKDKAGGDPNEWPEEFRVRQFPTVTVLPL